MCARMPRIPRNGIKTAEDDDGPPRRPQKAKMYVSTSGEKMCSPARAADPRNNTLLFIRRVRHADTDCYGRIQGARIVPPGRKRRKIILSAKFGSPRDNIYCSRQ